MARPGSNPGASEEEIRQLIHALSDRDGLRRQVARQALVAVGGRAIPALAEALRDPRERVRWEAAKALGEIGGIQAAPALVTALEDEEFGVRWLAAQGLISLGQVGLPALARELLHRPGSAALREGAHHVLKVLAADGDRELLAPVLAALEMGSSAAIALVADRLLAMSEAAQTPRRGSPWSPRRRAS